MSASMISHGLAGMSWWMILSFGWGCWKVKHVEQCFICFSISSLMFYPIKWFMCQEFGFSIPMWFRWSSSNACLKDSGITTCLPLSMIPSIIAMSSWNVQYVHMFCGIWSLFSMASLCKKTQTSSCDVACCNCCIVMQSGMFVVICLVSIFNCMPGISASLFSVWFCLESQSVMNRSGPGLYMILTLYWCILSRIHCILWGNVAVSFLKIATSGLWSVIILTSVAKQQWWNFLTPCSIPSASLSMLLYLLSTLDRLLLANVMDLSVLLSGALSLEELYHLWFVVGQLQVWLQMHLSLGTVVVSCHKISCMHLFYYWFCIANSSWYVAFHVHYVLLDVRCLSDSHMLAVLGQNLQK